MTEKFFYLKNLVTAIRKIKEKPTLFFDRETRQTKDNHVERHIFNVLGLDLNIKKIKLTNPERTLAAVSKDDMHALRLAVRNKYKNSNYKIADVDLSIEAMLDGQQVPEKYIVFLEEPSEEVAPEIVVHKVGGECTKQTEQDVIEKPVATDEQVIRSLALNNDKWGSLNKLGEYLGMSHKQVLEFVRYKQKKGAWEIGMDWCETVRTLTSGQNTLDFTATPFNMWYMACQARGNRAEQVQRLMKEIIAGDTKKAQQQKDPVQVALEELLATKKRLTDIEIKVEENRIAIPSAVQDAIADRIKHERMPEHLVGHKDLAARLGGAINSLVLKIAYEKIGHPMGEWTFVDQDGYTRTPTSFEKDGLGESELKFLNSIKIFGSTKKNYRASSEFYKNGNFYIKREVADNDPRTWGNKINKYKATKLVILKDEDDEN